MQYVRTTLRSGALLLLHHGRPPSSSCRELRFAGEGPALRAEQGPNESRPGADRERAGSGPRARGRAGERETRGDRDSSDRRHQRTAEDGGGGSEGPGAERPSAGSDPHLGSGRVRYLRPARSGALHTWRLAPAATAAEAGRGRIGKQGHEYIGPHRETSEHIGRLRVRGHASERHRSDRLGESSVCDVPLLDIPDESVQRSPTLRISVNLTNVIFS